ncbi:hypothetical protein [Streptomyces sp. NPDC091040]|uniref:hypothetical protein n=1 Tax=Streptomyces sp. NPDC091040 TaxID=3365972 RepID=UPI0038245877
MSDGISDGAEDVVGVLTERIESHFGMVMAELRAAVGEDPTANTDATEVVKWHGLLVQAQSALDRAENDLLTTLEGQPSEVDDPTLGLAHRVNEAVTTRDGRAMVVQWLLDPDAPGKKGLPADRLARLRSRTGPAVQTSPPRRPAEAPAPAPASAWPAGRLAR